MAGFAVAYRGMRWAVAADELPSPATAPPPAGSESPGSEPPGSESPSRERLRRAEPRPPFADRLLALTQLAEAAEAACRCGRMAKASEVDRQACSAFDALLAAHRDAGECAIRALRDAPPPPPPALVHVVQLVLRAELQRRTEVGELVGAALELLTRGPALAPLADTLADGPWLGPAHENAVIALGQRAAAGALPRPAACALLAALWRNLEDGGSRTRGEIDELALAWLVDGNRCERSVAAARLLRDQRRRPSALAWLRTHATPELVATAAADAARDLPPPIAAATLCELETAVPRLTAAFAVVASRDPDAVVDRYYECLAHDRLPAARRDLIAALGLATPTPVVRAALELAIDADPSRDVRTQAVLALSAAAPTKAEAACHRILDHAETGRDPIALAIVVFALQNLQAAGLINAVARLARRLRDCPLSDESRVLLERIVGETLPPALLPSALRELPG
ncbi:MAG: hypothetical protein KDE27_28340 [Planctomycetes bacterium]|nr:hypothetical protein [Planctomycetota bacterium]